MDKLKILVADDHPIYRIGVFNLVQKNFRNAVFFEADNGIKAWELIQFNEPDIAILDINMPGIDGLEISKRIKLSSLLTKTILLTMYNELSLLQQAKENDVKGYLIKDNSTLELTDAINAVLKNGHYWSKSVLNIEKNIEKKSKKEEKLHNLLSELTNTELKILKLVAKGFSSKAISEFLFVTPKSVDNYRSRIIKKIEISEGTNSLLIWAFENKNFIDNI